MKHYIRSEQASFEWVLKRSFDEGRAIAWFERDFKGPRIFGVPRFLYRLMAEKTIDYFWKFVLMREKDNRYQERYNLEVLKGKFYQYYKMSKVKDTRVYN